MTTNRSVTLNVNSQTVAAKPSSKHIQLHQICGNCHILYLCLQWHSQLKMTTVQWHLHMSLWEVFSILINVHCSKKLKVTWINISLHISIVDVLKMVPYKLINSTHHILQFIDNPSNIKNNVLAKLFFIDFSSSSNIIQPHRIMQNFCNMEVNTEIIL